MGASSRWADWLAVGAPSPTRRGVLWVYEFKNANPWKARKNLVPHKTHHEIHISPATATTSRRRATNHDPRVSPCSPASLDPGFVEISLVELSQSVKTTNITHTCTLGILDNGILYAPRYEEAFLPKGKKKGKKRPHYNPICFIFLKDVFSAAAILFPV